MVKRKVDDDLDIDLLLSGLEDEEMQEVVDVDFDYFDLNLDIDFHSIRTFVRQLFGDDADGFDISGISDLVLKEGAVGTTIKTDGVDSDPFALLLVVNYTRHRDTGAMQGLSEYLLKKTASNTKLNMVLRQLMQPGAPSQLGFVVSERLINMPVEVMPPMYKMFVLELEAAQEKGNAEYSFDHFLVVLRVYQLVASTIDDEDEGGRKRKKTPATPQEQEYFHYEDMVLENNAVAHGVFDYDHQGDKILSDARRVFNDYGVVPKLSVMVLSREALHKCVPLMEEKFPPF